MPAPRQSTGIPALDKLLGGGLLPGSLTVVSGATGIGKTQLGVQYARGGSAADNDARSGVVFDMSSRGDSQNHSGYAAGLYDWQMKKVSAAAKPGWETLFELQQPVGDYLHVFDYSGRRVTRNDLEFEQWKEWQSELNVKLQSSIAFLYANFLRGCQRVVVDGIEPSDRPQESIQFNLFEYIYHQVLRKEPAWVARDLFRQKYRMNAAAVEAHQYEPQKIGCMLLCTSQETMLDDLISRGIDEGDALSNANTLIYMGKTRDGNRIGRGLYIAKHRGSACSEEIIPYTINDQGLQIGGSA